MNVKVGDKVMASYGDYCLVKRITAINPITIAVESIYGGGYMPKQNPKNWYVVVPETAEKIMELFEEAKRLRKEANKLLRTMPKVELWD